MEGQFATVDVLDAALYTVAKYRLGGIIDYRETNL